MPDAKELRDSGGHSRASSAQPRLSRSSVIMRCSSLPSNSAPEQRRSQACPRGEKRGVPTNIRCVRRAGALSARASGRGPMGLVGASVSGNSSASMARLCQSLVSTMRTSSIDCVSRIPNCHAGQPEWRHPRGTKGWRKPSAAGTPRERGLSAPASIRARRMLSSRTDWCQRDVVAP